MAQQARIMSTMPSGTPNKISPYTRLPSYPKSMDWIGTAPNPAIPFPSFRSGENIWTERFNTRNHPKELVDIPAQTLHC